jgi:hypothetical protein
MGKVAKGRWEVEFCRFRDSNPVVEALLELRRRNVKLGIERMKRWSKEHAE